MSQNTDRDWEFYGKTNPYYGVVTHEEFRNKNLDDDTLTKFFNTGVEHVSSVLETINKHILSDFKPTKVLDFGCGVGRLVIPFSSKCDFVVGVDVSSSILQEAQKNCQNRSITNVEFIQGDDDLSQVKGSFDLIHSFIVLQHIPAKRGQKLFQRLVDLLDEGGVGVLHVTYKQSSSRYQIIKSKFPQLLPFALKIYSLLREKRTGEPVMQMNEYDLNSLLSILQNSGCKNVYLEFTRHGEYFDGVTIFFQKNHT